MPVTGDTQGLHNEVLTRLERISKRLGKDVVVTSGKRPGSPSDSAHNSGIAADARVDGLTSVAFADELVKEGFTGVGEYYTEGGAEERFAHGDLRGLPAAAAAGPYAPGGSKSKPLCWYRVGTAYTYGARKSGHSCPQ